MQPVPGWVWPNALMLLAAGAYLWSRLVVGTTRRGGTSRLIGTVVAALLAICGPVALIGQYLLPLSVQRVLGWPGWLGYTVLVFLGFACLLTEPVRLALWWRRRAGRNAPVHATATTPATTAAATAQQPPQLPRRLLIRRGLAAGIVAVGGSFAGIGMVGAFSAPRVRRATIAIPALPAEAVGTRIALISDLHVGSLTTRADCQRVVDLVNAQNPDIVCLAGDFSDGSAAELGADLEPLAGLRATDGVYFVTGNHEFYYDPDSWFDFIPRLGIRLLNNEGLQVRGMLLAGLNDIYGEPSGRGPNFDAAMSSRVPGQPVVLLSHSPSIVDDAADRGVDLLLSGHTHGGQFYPVAWVIAATTPALSGLYTFGPTQVFVTNGCRFWGPVARLGVPSDVTIIELVAA